MASSHNPFRGKLPPAATESSINPPPSFHAVAGEDETTLNPLTDTVPDLPSMPEAERNLPLIPIEERDRKQPYPSPVITLEPPPPPAYTATPEIRRDEPPLDVGPGRPSQQPPSMHFTALSHDPTPTVRQPSVRSIHGPGVTSSYTGPTTTSSSADFLASSLAGFPFRRNRPNLIQLIAGSLAAGFGPSAGDSSAAQSSQGGPHHAHSFSSFASSPGPSLPPHPHPPATQLSHNPSGVWDRSPSTVSRSTTTRSTTSANFARDFYVAEEPTRVDSEFSGDYHRSHGADNDIGAQSIPRRRNSFDASQMATSNMAPQLHSQPSTSSLSSPTLVTVDDSKLRSNSVRSHRYLPSEPSYMPPHMPPYSMPPYMPSHPPVGPSVVVSGVGSPAPAGAPVYPAGDRRQGGVRCWMCGGTGTVSKFIFDRSQCETCKGIGKWYM
ncbi:hypothetical protein APHAL10511_000726 [Amanita phalloides]|nr:hypothetical protein APHAL10511_000726 [Amanita phalloides]